MVRIVLPETLCMGVRHLRAASPLTWTVHAPHKPMPQPNFEPVSSSSSRRYQSRGMAGSPAYFLDAPFTLRRIMSVVYTLFPGVRFAGGVWLQGLSSRSGGWRRDLFQYRR